jgi:ATP-dependent RNA helicase RhlE
LLDHLEQGTINLDAVECLVLDEADRMLDMGFIRDIRKIMKSLPRERQNLLFSATFSNEIRRLAADLLNSPTEISVATNGKPAEGIDQVVYRVDRQRKRELLSHMIGSQDWRQVLVFTRTKHGANRLAAQLETDGLNSAAIHGNKSQGARLRALQDFKTGKVRVPHVVNFELPHVPEDYVHRIGRTARAGHTGQAASLVCIDEHRLLADIEKLLQMKISNETVPGYEPDPRIKAEPITQGRAQRSPGRNKNRRNAGRSGSSRSGRQRSAAN